MRSREDEGYTASQPFLGHLARVRSLEAAIADLKHELTDSSVLWNEAQLRSWASRAACLRQQASLTRTDMLQKASFPAEDLSTLQHCLDAIATYNHSVDEANQLLSRRDSPVSPVGVLVSLLTSWQYLEQLQASVNQQLRAAGDRIGVDLELDMRKALAGTVAMDLFYRASEESTRLFDRCVDAFEDPFGEPECLPEAMELHSEFLDGFLNTNLINVYVQIAPFGHDQSVAGRIRAQRDFLSNPSQHQSTSHPSIWPPTAASPTPMSHQERNSYGSGALGHETDPVRGCRQKDTVQERAALKRNHGNRASLAALDATSPADLSPSPHPVPSSSVARSARGSRSEELTRPATFESEERADGQGERGGSNKMERAVMDAITSGDQATLAQLSFNPSGLDGDGLPYLWAAIEAGKDDIALDLLTRGDEAVVQFRHPRYGHTVLHLMSARFRSVVYEESSLLVMREAAKRLLSELFDLTHECSPDLLLHRNTAGQTILHVASSTRNFYVFDVFRLVDVHRFFRCLAIEDDSGFTPLGRLAWDMCVSPPVAPDMDSMPPAPSVPFALPVAEDLTIIAPIRHEGRREKMHTGGRKEAVHAHSAVMARHSSVFAQMLADSDEAHSRVPYQVESDDIVSSDAWKAIIPTFYGQRIRCAGLKGLDWCILLCQIVYACLRYGLHDSLFHTAVFELASALHECVAGPHHSPSVYRAPASSWAWLLDVTAAIRTCAALPSTQPERRHVAKGLSWRVVRAYLHSFYIQFSPDEPHQEVAYTPVLPLLPPLRYAFELLAEYLRETHGSFICGMDG
ncbi:unnamed protein product [Vitrella brassicaformis CCMP3155]|uniref:BTB domain-containing protein n=3 Tax=Vitrella brassicaformis TaxID=1169539 RepID=A0A0G4GK54_VITBC|nr:unnamed protein product [Vitrella brassicaformis CCMP3155]|eukprot:CEM30318.1 unnamed protein product [Vitrella brassicaformis CCMP3155]